MWLMLLVFLMLPVAALAPVRRLKPAGEAGPRRCPWFSPRRTPGMCRHFLWRRESRPPKTSPNRSYKGGATIP